VEPAGGVVEMARRSMRHWRGKSGEETCLTSYSVRSSRSGEHPSRRRGRAEYTTSYRLRVPCPHRGANGGACGSDADGVCWAGVEDLDRYRVTAAAAAVIRKRLRTKNPRTIRNCPIVDQGFPSGL